MRATLWLILILAAGEAAADARRTTVAVDFAALDEAAYRKLDALALEQRVVLRLAQEGFAVVVRAADPQILIELRVLPDRVVIVDAAAPALRHREVTTGAEPVRELTHLEVAQKIVELARASRAALPPPAVASEAAPPRTPLAYELAAGGGALVRSGGVDPEARVGLRMDRAGRAGLLFEGAAASATGGGVSVWEAELAVGAGYRVPLGAHLWFQAGLLGGVLLHHFALDDQALQEPSGTRADVIASAPLSLAIAWPGAGPGLALRVAPGITGRRREHDLAQQPLWERGAFRMDVGMVVYVRF